MKLLTLARDLQRRKARERHHRFVAEGVRTVEALLDSTLDVVGLLVSTSLADDERGAAVRDRALSRGYALQEVSEAEFTSAAGTEAPQGILAIASIPARAFDSPPPIARFLILDALQDPGNVGTVIRTAAALGVTATLALPGTVDLWNAKVVRSSMGAIFSHAAWMCTWESVVSFLDEHEIVCCASDTDGQTIESALDLGRTDRLALVVGNEGAGLSAPVAARSAHRVAVRMTPGVESLNVAVATGILLHALRPM